MMQSNWDTQSIFYHPIQSDQINVKKDNGIREIELSFFSLIKKIVGEKNKTILVFHAQSSLPYLIPVLLISGLLNKKNISFIYDIHDLHERNHFKNIVEKVRYDIIRYRLLGLMEWFIFKIKKVKIITISNGLASILAKRYKSALPTVVYNISVNLTQKRTKEKKDQPDRELLYFGTKKHSPISLIPDIYKENLRLHMYGYNITSEWLEEKVGTQNLDCVKLYGRFLPDQMNFLSKYKILLLYSPDSTAINYKTAMPNKIFQALYNGLSVIISENFKEVENTFSDIPGAVTVHKSGGELHQTLNDLKAERDQNYRERISMKLEVMINESKQNYLYNSN